MTFTSELFVDSIGQHIEVHERNDDCVQHGCCIHAPSDHHMRDWPLLWRADAGKMERICPHGVGHDDPDSLAFANRMADKRGDKRDVYLGVHGCDGCCQDPEA